MYRFKELTGLTRTTVGALWLYMGINLLVALSLFYSVAVIAAPSQGLLGFIGFAALLSIVSAIATVILVACWIYRANANAHVLGGGLSITPGWAVGWYFVPVACLFQPYIAMKETWLASHFGNDWGNGDATHLLRWWWGLWIVNGVLGYLLIFTRQGPPELGAACTLVAGLLDTALIPILIRIMKQINDAQKITRNIAVFA